MSEHTPGPWSYFDDGYGEECDPPEPGKRWLSIRADGYDEIAVLVRRGGEPTTDQHANARLIAAAPRLLAAAWGALAVACDDHECADCGNGDEHDDGCAFLELERAIDQALGKSAI